MIRIGLAGWGDHDELYEKGTAARDKLRVYGTYFGLVEVDSSFYAVQSRANYERWAADTPQDFGFVIKAYQGMTGHQRGRSPFPDEETMFGAFRESIEPVREAGKLKAVLFQYPPWFDCKKAHVEELRLARERMGDLPLALEFRHQSWFAEEMREKTLSFMQREGWIHSICDEPQAGPGSVPTVLQATDRRLTIVRMHGRNAANWNGGGGPNWREVRYLYNYSEEELLEWKANLAVLGEQTEEVCFIFNNNSGGHAAGNAVRLMEMLGQPVRPFAPQQLDLF
ncbi:hypothetical protein PM3016_7278 [Paenibacillus mucilaginosus 3016]|uniref:YunF n=2 Tax=Paenibacillus mucilaginosus TaxID=61624 RepID=H6NE78_9BACL|nr:DUF72 domain-containing protein [Paenibacillus mucilaginosus]AFC33854.1 hypothetical protein PM3016_7278 [Paenibacillus mucilaginosus 3016]AFH66180.1 hypothetical protein B2K_36725 [Paenibacillus mucilaginosus K02]WFA22236.1 DUF72 domain-containing protein [Paenibacillus mucilaginosus]